ncbi:ABC transporter substrate-binding protein [Desulfofundulus thermocisternus]|uniref:ABC transporter substrate-binding protein n=1 Tax=Desulfofundulus thermocisternus TaxID=42471 RepID=UPI00217EB1BC|nr:ABC transporter substrate-binding protein [Desulfofundulus thermocisternus]MCS5695415.1 ABC transporter substrate-binding protein [Desulfofundulus thermocisternus]
MPRKCFLIVLLLVISLSLLLFGCGTDQARDDRKPGVAKGGEQQQVDVIRLAGGDWGYPSPYAHYPRGPGIFKMCLIFDGLLERDEKGLIPWLAEKYEIKEGGKQYLFTIRDGVKWQDGKPLTAGDVKFTFEYASKHPMVSSYIGSKDIEKVEVVGDRQVLITVSEPNAAMLYNLGLTRIIPKHIWENVDNPKEFTKPEAVIGTGPYRLTEYNKEHGTYRFEAFEDFWGPRQRVKVIEFVPVSEEILAFEKGEIDLAGVTPDVLPRFQNDPQYKIVKNPGFWGYRLLFNMGDYPVLRHKELRQAIAYAIDANELIEKVARGAAVPGSAGILPPDHVMYNPNVKQYKPDLQKAGELLAKLGYDKLDERGIRQNQKGEKLSFNLLVSSGEVRLAEVLKEQLARAGIEIKVQSVDMKTRDARVRENKYELAITGHGGWGNDPDYLRERFAGRSRGGLSPSASGLRGYNNDELNNLLEKQRLEMDDQKRKQLIFKIQEILAEDVPEIPLYYTTGYNVYRPAKYDGWMFMFDHHSLTHSKLSYLERG